MGPIVSTEWLAGELGSADLLVFEATKYLPNQQGDARAEFAASHVPGARYFDVDEIADPETDLPHMIPSAGRFARLVGRLGIGNGSRIVFYDRNDMMWAGRAWWLMGLFGHDQAAVLDGGFAKWLREGRPTEVGEPAALAPAAFVPDFRAQRLRGLGDLRSNVESRAEIVLDARAAARFAGSVPEIRPGLRSGHIPGSRNLPYADLLSAERTFLDPAALRAKLAAAGIDGGTPVVTSCGSGVSATILTLAMLIAGLPAGALYDGSWTEWGGRGDTPVAT